MTVTWKYWALHYTHDIVPWSFVGLQCETQMCWTEHRLATHKHPRLHCLYFAAC